MSLVADVTSKVRDSSGKLLTADFTRLVAEALKRYSKHRPNTKVIDITGNGTNDYSLPTGWEADVSTIVSIEYPIGEVPATLLDNADYEIYQTPTEKKIRLKNDAPAATESFRLTHTILRVEATVPASDLDAVCNLAAALCLEELANAFPHSSSAKLAADVVNYRTKSQEFAARAKAHMALYKEHMGIKDDDITSAASAVSDLDIKYPGGIERLTHSRRYKR